MKKNTLQTKIEYPKTNKLDRKCLWIRPEFQPYDGIVEVNIWELEGLIVAIGFIDEDQQKVIGSGIMIAPGVCLTATHVIEETFDKQALLFSFPSSSSMRIWIPEDFHAIRHNNSDFFSLRPEHKYSDVSVLSYSPFSDFQDQVPHYYSPVEVCLPKIGERLWAVGYKELSDDGGIPKIGFFITSGLVVEQFTKGRGSYIQGACIQVAMKSLGGMSGGPVFNASGRVVGVISTCFEGVEDNNGPTFVTLVWPALISKVKASWPEDKWPNGWAGLQDVQSDIKPTVLGSAKLDDESLVLKFSRMGSDEIHDVFISAGVKQAVKSNELYDYIYELFEDDLQEVGLSFLGDLSNNTHEQTYIDPDISVLLQSWKTIGADTYEGLEDIDIISASLLESGKVGVDITFDIRCAFLKLKMSYDYFSDYELSKEICNTTNVDDGVECDYYIRPYFRSTFSYDPINYEITDLRFHRIYVKK